MNDTDYYESIKLHHSFVYPANSLFYISIWNGVLRDGRIQDIDIQFFEAKHPKIISGFLSFDNKNIYLSEIQLKYLKDFF